MANPSANRSYLTPGPRLLKLITKVHIRLYEKTRGTLGAVVFQFGEEGEGLLRRMDVLILGTTGRKSGTLRKVTLPFFQYEGRLFVIASNAASEKHPAWFLNLRANPEVTVMLGPAELRAVARPLEGEEYERLWAEHTRRWPRWRMYQERTSRRIPMVELAIGAR